MTSEPDNLDRLWTPDRLAYVSGATAPVAGYDTPAGCPFCLAPQLPPDEGLVIARGRTVYALLNRYPYNPGHLMVCPVRHVADYTELTVAETTELARFTQTAMRVVRAVSGPPGFNLGMNQGSIAGAGVAGHLHQHVVPRWGGDTNFMPVIGRTKVLPQLLPDTRRLLAQAWPADQAVGAEPVRVGRKPAAVRSNSRTRTAAPTRTAPTRAATSDAASATARTKAASARAASAKAAPVKTAPVKTAPVKTAPVKTTGPRTAASAKTADAAGSTPKRRPGRGSTAS